MYVLVVGVFENLPSDLSLSDNDELEQNSLEFSCPQLASNGSVFTKKIYLCSHSTGSRKIDVTVNSCYCHMVIDILF